MLCRYAVVILDEAHESSLQTEIFVFRVVKRTMKARAAITTRTVKQSLHDNNANMTTTATMYAICVKLVEHVKLVKQSSLGLHHVRFWAMTVKAESTF
jgi:hypothetical protein